MKSITPLLLLSSLAVTSVSAKWERLSSLEKRPIEVTSAAFAGTKIDSSQGIGRANAFVSDDPVDAAVLSAGNSSAVISLAKPSVVERIDFTNDGVEGKVTISASTDKSAWVNLGSEVFSPADRFVEVGFAGIQAKYLRVDFQLTRNGTIRNFQTYGGTNDMDYTVTQSEDGSGQDVNFASGLGGARVVYAAPKVENSSDEAASFNKFDFPESDEKYRTIIYDLGQVRRLDEFGSVHSPRPVRFEVFTFDTLPQKEDWRGRLTFDPAAFDSASPVASAEDSRGLGYINAKPKEAVRAQYVALRWEPDFNPPSFSVGGTSVSGGGCNVGFTPGAGGPGAGSGGQGPGAGTGGGEGAGGEGGGEGTGGGESSGTGDTGGGDGGSPSGGGGPGFAPGAGTTNGVGPNSAPNGSPGPT